MLVILIRLTRAPRSRSGPHKTQRHDTDGCAAHCHTPTVSHGRPAFLRLPLPPHSQSRTSHPAAHAHSSFFLRKGMFCTTLSLTHGVVESARPMRSGIAKRAPMTNAKPM